LGTRACYIFKDADQSFCVYGHWDGMPSGALEKILDTVNSELCWEFPRFEASDFAAAFVAANKHKGGGGIYLTTSPKYHGDLAYTYEITFKKEHLWVKVYRYNSTKKAIFSGPLADMALRIESIGTEDD
jgi:hypothetical protein